MNETEYWIIVDEQPAGPYTREQLRQHPAFGSDTMVWYESLTDWIAASQIAALADICAPQPAVCESPGPVPGMPQVPADDDSMPAIPPSHAMFQPGVIPEPPTDPTGGITPDEALLTALPARPSNYIGWSIVAIYFFIPLGIVALLYSLGVNRNHARGNHVRAHRCSELAQWWIIISIVLGLVSAPVRFAVFGF